MNHEIIRIPPYDQVPKVRKEIEEIENLIETRMNMIDKIDNKNQNAKPKNETYRDNFIFSLFSDKEDLIGWKNKIEEDIVSHFFLCSAFCRNEMQKNWYLSIYIIIYISPIVIIG